jgi:N utilization substance protein B
MDNKLKSKTRLAAIQIVSQQLINNQDITNIKDDFDKYYRNTKIDKSSAKIEYNINFLSKLINCYKKMNLINIYKEINDLIAFDRNFEKWDTINKAILLVAISELKNSPIIKYRIILNDYLEISKSFVNSKDTKIINAILDKFIK